MANTRICTIDDCGKPHEARGYCNKHYLAMRITGDPLGSRYRAEPDALMSWMTGVALNYCGTDCLLWPFGKGKDGCGLLSVNGKRVRAPRVACEHKNGPPPHCNSVARHTCGNGDQGCVNPNHLIWGSQYENAQDTIAHGKSTRGFKNPQAKLTTDAVRAIRKMAGTQKHKDIAVQFGVTSHTVGAIHRRVSWGWLEDE